MTNLLGLDREPGSDLPLADQFRFDAGSAALNLLATLGFRRSDAPVERLTSPGRVRAWLDASALPAVPVTTGDVERLKVLREHAYAVLRALIDGRRPSRTDVDALGTAAGRSTAGRTLRLDGSAVRWQEAAPTFDTILVGLARDLAAVAVESTAQLSSCPADNCGMIFLDQSRGRRRRWCSMGRCGNAAKAQRHRDRQGHRARQVGR